METLINTPTLWQGSGLVILNHRHCSNSSYLVIFWGVCSLNQELQESSSSWVQLGENSERIFIYSLCPELCSNYDKTNLFRVLPIAMETHMENSSPRPLSMRNPGVQPSLTDSCSRFWERNPENGDISLVNPALVEQWESSQEREEMLWLSWDIQPSALQS